MIECFSQLHTAIIAAMRDPRIKMTTEKDRYIQSSGKVNTLHKLSLK